MAKIDDLQAELEKLRAEVAQLRGISQPRRKLAPEELPDYVEFGSERHALLLGLEKDEDGNWRLADITRYGPMATPQFLEATLQQKLNELNSKPSVPASAPELWTPPDAQQVSVMV